MSRVVPGPLREEAGTGAVLAVEDLGVRERIVEAMVALVGGRGYGRTDLEMVLNVAGVSEADFRRHYDSKEDCFLKIWAELAGERIRRAHAAFERERRWPDRLRAAVWESVRFFRADRLRTRFLVLEVLNAGELALVQREMAMARGIPLVDAGRAELDDPSSVSPAVARHVVGAFYATLVEKTRSGEVFEGCAWLPELMYLAVRPYLGHAAALEELSIEPPWKQEAASGVGLAESGAHQPQIG